MAKCDMPHIEIAVKITYMDCAQIHLRLCKHLVMMCLTPACNLLWPFSSREPQNYPTGVKVASHFYLVSMVPRGKSSKSCTMKYYDFLFFTFQIKLLYKLLLNLHLLVKSTNILLLQVTAKFGFVIVVSLITYFILKCSFFSLFFC